MGKITIVTQDSKKIDRIKEIQTKIIKKYAKDARRRIGEIVPQTTKAKTNPTEDTIDRRTSTKTLTILKKRSSKKKLQQVHLLSYRLPSYAETEQKYKQV